MTGINFLDDSAASFQSAALLTENHAAQLVTKLFCFVGIAGASKAFGQFEEGLLFLFPRFDAQFDEFHKDAVVAQALSFGHAVHLPGNGSGEGYAASDLLCYRHGIIIHQFGALLPAVKDGASGPSLTDARLRWFQCGR
jgi:hypothetical protein